MRWLTVSGFAPTGTRRCSWRAGAATSIWPRPCAREGPTRIASTLRASQCSPGQCARSHVTGCDAHQLTESCGVCTRTGTQPGGCSTKNPLISRLLGVPLNLQTRTASTPKGSQCSPGQPALPSRSRPFLRPFIRKKCLLKGPEGARFLMSEVPL